MSNSYDLGDEISSGVSGGFAIAERRIQNLSTPTVPNLNAQERLRACRLGERLGSEIARTLRELPESARGGSGLSRFLRMDRATCQRIVQAGRLRDGLEVLGKAPGPAGLRQFVDSVGPHISSGSQASLAAASEEYVHLVRELGGSQTRLLARLDEQGDRRAMASDGDVRATLFESAARLVGRWSEVGVFVSLYAPTADGERMDRVNVTGFVGHRAHGSAIPLTTGSGRLQPKAGESGSALSLDGSPAEGSTPLALFEEFCTRPLPRVTSRHPGSGLTQIVDHEDHEGDERGRAADIVTARMNATPIDLPSADDPLHAIWMTVNYPARRLLADVYLHRSLARRCIPSAGVHMNDLHNFDPQDWATKFPDQPTLQVLGSGAEHSASTAYARQGELTRSLFDRIGWDPEQFVGYRCEVEYPIWRAGYCVWFDFSGEDE